MTPLRAIANLAVVAAAPASMFLAQTWLMANGRSDAVLALAQYGGLIGLVFLLFDGASGLAPALMRLRHPVNAIRSAYLVYRCAILVLLLATLPLFWLAAPTETIGLMPFLTASLLLRLPLLDADLDRRGRQHWSMLLQNGWMLPLALTAALAGEVGSTAAGHTVFWSSLLLFAAHRFLVRERQPIGGDFRAPIGELLSIVGAQGIGQAYGRAVLFMLGTSFAGPLAALVIYAKQAFNAAGPIVTYLRRAELTQSRTDMRLSIFGQVGIGIAAGVLVFLAAARVDLSASIALLLIVWQVLEKLSANAVYSHQIGGRHGLALGSLTMVTALGLLGLAMAHGRPLLFVAAEALGYGIVLTLWYAARRQDTRIEVRP